MLCLNIYTEQSPVPQFISALKQLNPQSAWANMWDCRRYLTQLCLTLAQLRHQYGTFVNLAPTGSTTVLTSRISRTDPEGKP
jgi:hypothetical protein